MMPDRATVGRMPMRLVLAGPVALVCSLLLGFGANAADGITAVPVPAEPDAQVMGTPARAAIAFDLDGDGVRELLRLRPELDLGGRQLIDAWRVGPGGRLTAIGQEVLFRGASVDEILAGSPRPTRTLLPVSIEEPARFVIWHQGGRQRLLVVTIGTRAQAVACCLTVWQVGLRDADHIDLQLLLNTQDNAAALWSLDLDGDGTDELVLTQQPRRGASNEVPLRALRWTGAGFSTLRSSFVAPPGWAAVPVADSDGRRGAELLISSDRIDGGPGAVLQRITLRAGVVHVETWPVHQRGTVAVLPDAKQPRVAVIGDSDGITQVFSWPADGQARELASGGGFGRLLGVMGSGAGARILLDTTGIAPGAATAGTPSMVVLEPHLLSIEAPTPRPPAIAFHGGRLVPYSGPFPGGLTGGTAAWIFAGNLIPDQSTSPAWVPLSTRPMALLPGMVPVGVLGPGGGWAALLQLPGSDTATDGGPLLAAVAGAPLAGRLSIAPTAAVLAPESGDGLLRPGIEGAIRDPQRLRDTAVVSGQRQVRALVLAPPDSVVGLALGSGFGFDSAVLRPMPASGELTLDIGPPSDGSRTFGAALGVVTPDGHGYATHLDVRLLLDPPKLAADATTDLFSLRVPLAGITDPGTSVSVDGRGVAVDAAGRFSATLDGSLLPRDVRIAAVDVVGNRATVVLSVVGFVDYRQLPWVPLVVVLTVVAGALLYVRAPRLRSRPARSPDDDAVLEDLDQPG